MKMHERCSPAGYGSGRRLLALLLLAGLGAGAASAEQPTGSMKPRVPLWVGANLVVPAPGPSHLSPRPLETLSPIMQQSAAGSRRRSNPNKQAIIPALMSAVIPGAGQLKNGSILRGLGYVVAEVGAWVAYTTFEKAADDKLDQMAGFAEGYWDYNRYHTIAPDPIECENHGCPKDQWTPEADSIIVLAQDASRNRFLDYITRDAYACGWDTQTSRGLYRNLWDDREDLLSASSFSGRVIFLNHLISAVDAFMEARKVQIRLTEDTAMTLRVRGVPDATHPRLMISTSFGGYR